MMRTVPFSLVLACLLTGATAGRSQADTAANAYDVVIYGGTSAAVTAAAQAHRMGRSVVVISPDKHLGGLSSGGLGWTDTGNKAVIGGLAREFYHRVWKHYQRPDAWRWQKPEEYGNRGQGTAAVDGQQRTMWIFEPHVAERVFDHLIRETRVPVLRDEWLQRDGGVYELLARVLAAGWDEVFRKFDPIPNWKTDTNNHGPFSTDNIGRNYDYPEASLHDSRPKCCDRRGAGDR